MSMHNLIEYSDNYLKTSGILCQFYRDAPAVNNDGAIVDFTDANATTESLNLKIKLTDQTGNNGTKMLK